MRQSTVYGVYDSDGNLCYKGTLKELSDELMTDKTNIWAAGNGKVKRLFRKYTVVKESETQDVHYKRKPEWMKKKRKRHISRRWFDY